MYTAKVTYADGTFRTLDLLPESREGTLTLSIEPHQLGDGALFVDFAPELVVAMEGDEGYFLLPQSRNDEDHMLCRFKGHKEDTVYESENPTVPIFGVKHSQRSFLAVVSGMPYSYHMIAGVMGGIYYLYPRFLLGGKAPYESICVTYYDMSFEKADYIAMARLYRSLLLNSGKVTPIEKRGNEVLDYAKESLYVRIRMAWKPAPSPIADQTVEEEPPVHVACDFDRVGELMDAYHERGIDKAEFCLVGWNISGHDGRWPQTFPVEPKLGGEEKLRALVEKGKRLGYQVTCHTNSNSAFHIADGFTTEWLRRDADGKILDSNFLWSGGLEYELCPKIAYEFAAKVLPRVAEIGFTGLHYVDVLGLLPLKECHHPSHPVTLAQCRDYYKRIAKLSRDLFGGFSTEGARAHLASSIDFGLYVSYKPCLTEEVSEPIADEYVPLWQLIFHGIVLSNPYTDTVNAPVKSRKHVLKLFERGGRPTLYYYSKFVTENNEEGLPNWMGNTDFIMDTDEDLALSADRAAALYHEYKSLSYLQDFYMENYERLSKDEVRVTYSDGSVLTVNYADETVTVEKK